MTRDYRADVLHAHLLKVGDAHREMHAAAQQVADDAGARHRAKVDAAAAAAVKAVERSPAGREN